MSILELETLMLKKLAGTLCRHVASVLTR